MISLADSDATSAAYPCRHRRGVCALGIFGVPTFAVRGELFWGDDRLEDAIRCYASGLPANA